MSLAVLAGLVGLALLDSTSVGTLLVPLALLLAPRVAVTRYLAYLATVAGFYAVVGLGLALGAGWIVEVSRGIGEVAPFRWVQLVAGTAMLAVGVFGSPRRWFGGRPRLRDGGSDRLARWRTALAGTEPSYSVVVGIGLLAALVEVGSMLPFLGAVGLIGTAEVSTAATVGLVLGYTVVMVLPALLLLALRVGLGRRVEPVLARTSAALGRHAGEMGLWALAIVGYLVVADALVALDAFR